MTVLNNYHHFAGRHYETGSLHNIYSYHDIPLSEALLLGISGGITFGYFLFDYEGYDPYFNILTRNTFDPLDTIFDRLSIARNVFQTTDETRARQNLLDALDQGDPALVWVDFYSMPYNRLPNDENMWMIAPVVIFGLEDGKVCVADRSSQPLTVDVQTFMQARGRVKKDKYRVMSLEMPDMDKLPTAIQKGIWQCINLFTEAPPKGSRKNFGFEAYDQWSNMLTNTRNKQSWERFFPAGSRLYAAQKNAISWIQQWGMADGAERGAYADFMDEAATILNKPALSEVGETFRRAADEWNGLAKAFLPEDVPLLRETRELLTQQHTLFTDYGDQKMDKLRSIDQRLEEIKSAVISGYPMSDSEVAAYRERLQSHVETIASLERDAIQHLQDVMAWTGMDA
ncbi:MAG: BtrH N-terminal domain-containing protein [Chloroflexi bacterium]|nr:BtrH N-terminal domain-containing protein [Chloroflexota bacterium]